VEFRWSRFLFAVALHFSRLVTPHLKRVFAQACRESLLARQIPPDGNIEFIYVSWERKGRMWKKKTRLVRHLSVTPPPEGYIAVSCPLPAHMPVGSHAVASRRYSSFLVSRIAAKFNPRTTIFEALWNAALILRSPRTRYHFMRTFLPTGSVREDLSEA
jgi:hypothetical protein